MNDTGDSLSNLVSSNVEEDAEDGHGDDVELGKLSKEDEPGWVMGPTSTTSQHPVEGLNQMQI